MKFNLPVIAILILVCLAACDIPESSTSASSATPAKVSVSIPPVTVPPSAKANLFVNPGFEDGAEPWLSLTTRAWGEPFSVSREVAHAGIQSARLNLRAREAAGARIVGVVQETKSETFPELLSGYYQVAKWVRGTGIQYIQFVVIVFDSENAPMRFPNHQIRYLLAGTDKQPFSIGNAKFIYVGTEEATPGGWVYFARNLREDFIDQWGDVPKRFSKIRVLFEVRYDKKQQGETDSSAVVYFDDLYLGSAGSSSGAP